MPLQAPLASFHATCISPSPPSGPHLFRPSPQSNYFLVAFLSQAFIPLHTSPHRHCLYFLQLPPPSACPAHLHLYLYCILLLLPFALQTALARFLTHCPPPSLRRRYKRLTDRVADCHQTPVVGANNKQNPPFDATTAL